MDVAYVRKVLLLMGSYKIIYGFILGKSHISVKYAHFLVLSLEAYKDMRVHTGDKPYQCQHCSYRCTQSSSLQKHKKTHEILKKQVKNKNENADEENIYIIVPNDI